jgi:hypothetical protein
MYINYYSLEKFLLLLFLIVLFLRGMFTPKNSPNQGRCCSLTKYFILVTSIGGYFSRNISFHSDIRRKTDSEL